MPNTTPIPLKPTSGVEVRLKAFMRRRIMAIRQGCQVIHEDRVVNWRKAYEAIPAESIREFPFYNASNNVIPIIAIHSDTLLARVMAAVLKTQPPWVAKIYGEHVDAKAMDERREAVEEFMTYVSIEPSELDLFRVYHEWYGETIRYGTSTVKCPQVKIIEASAYTAGDGSGKTEFEDEVLYKGPRPEKIRFSDFGVPPSAKTLEDADFVYHRIRLQKHQLQERAFYDIYDKKVVDEVLKSPDRTSPDVVQSSEEQDTGAVSLASFGYAEYHIYECHFKYRFGEHYVRVIAWYHERTNSILRAFYFYYPDQIFVTARLFYRDDMFFGYGFCERLAPFQEEISQMHNQRRDNMTVVNTKVWRVDPDSQLHKGYRVFPSAMLPARKDEIEPLSQGDVSAMSIEEENLSIELAEKLSGVSPPMQGYGAGTNTKRGVYTAMGTLSLMQEGNTRTDLNVTDIRYAHTKLGRILLNQYAHFGLGDRVGLFGKMSDRLREAMDLVKQKAIALPVYAATASVNREVEKQADVMLSQMMQKHYGMVTQMLMQAQNAMLPDPVKKYIGEAVLASNLLMKSVLRHFGRDEVDRLVPDAEAAPPQQPQARPGGAGANNAPPPASPIPAGANGALPGLPATAALPSGAGPGPGGIQ
jgi:hypothetical protein